MNIENLQKHLSGLKQDTKVLFEDTDGFIYDIVGLSSINKDGITFKIRLKDSRDIYEIFRDLVDNVKEFDRKFQDFKLSVNGGDDNDSKRIN